MTRTLLLGVVLVAAATLLGAGCGSSGSPRPDLAFVSTRDGDYAIFGMNADGSRQKRLTHEKGDPATPQGLFFQVEPAWSPDGTQIAFSSKRDGASHVFVMRADGSDTRRLTETKLDDANPAWSPDGGRIAFDRAGDIYVVTADGSQVHRVGNDPAEEADPAWSPNGRWLAYARRTPGTTFGEIWLMHPDGSGRHQVTHRKVSSRAPAWSPGGKQIAFSSEAHAGIYAIYTVGLDGKAPRQLSPSAVAGAYSPSWSLDGKTIAFWSDGSIYTVTLIGSQQQLTSGTNDSSPVWRPAQAGSGS
jgi:Tol biopolymer transport system component